MSCGTGEIINHFYCPTNALNLTSALDWGGWSAPHSGHFTPGKET